MPVAQGLEFRASDFPKAAFWLSSAFSVYFRSIMANPTRTTITVVGDRVLILPDHEKDRTRHGLYLPPHVQEKQRINSGYIVKVGPGYPVPNPNYVDQESWSTSQAPAVKYIPLQAEEGDYAIFLRDQAIEVEYEEKKYLIVQQSAVLLLIRKDMLSGISET
jgi:co-chaperonin GroES (HSP10)